MVSQWHRIRKVCTFLVALGMAIVGCSKKSLPPRTSAEVFYIGMLHYSTDPPVSRVYVYSTSNWALMDSLDIEELPVAMEASPDGEWLYFIGLDSYDLFKVSARTGAQSWRRAIPGVLRLIGNGTLLIGGGDDEHTGAVVDQESGATVSLLPDTLVIGFGPAWGTEVAATINENPGEFSPDSIVTVLDCKSVSTRGRFVPYVEGRLINFLYYARLHPDGKHVLVIGIAGGESGPATWFAVGNVETGQTVFTLRLNSPFGQSIIDRTGRQAVVTDPPWPGQGGGSTIHLISLDDYELLASFRFDPPTALHLGQAVYTASEDQIVAASYSPSFGGDPLILIDPRELEISDTIWLPDCDTTSLECPGVGAITPGLIEAGKTACE